MGITNASNGFRPGVCTSTTRPTTPFEGQMIYETDTDKVLVYNGSAWRYSTTPQTTEPGVWQDWTPTVTSSSGTLTTVTVNKARYTQFQKTVTAIIDFTITTIGTGSGVPKFTLPVTSITTNALVMGSYRETAVGGLIGVITWDTTTRAVLQRYDNASHLAANNRYEGTFTYEAA